MLSRVFSQTKLLYCFSSTVSQRNVSLSSLILAQQWLKNKQASSASIEVPEGMVKGAFKKSQCHH
jgi:hypothetical protein